jgi:hypothetical protein
VKDALAGRKVRCPDCQAVLTVATAAADADDEAATALLAGPPDPPRPKRLPREDAEDAPRHAVTAARPLPKPTAPARDEPKPRPRKKDRRKERGYSRVTIHPAIITGVLMMIGAVVWFGVGLAGGIIFFYPPILFVFGVGSVIKGFTGRD